MVAAMRLRNGGWRAPVAALGALQQRLSALALASLGVVAVLSAGVLAIAALGDPKAGRPRAVAVMPADAAPDATGTIVSLPAQEPVIPGPLIAGGTLVADPALLEKGKDGPLPVVAPDGRRPADVYARPFNASDPRPRIALVVTGLGVSESATADAIAKLPPEVALAFSAYAREPQASVNAARSGGREVLLDVPMEPFDFPNNDAGPYALMAGNTASENVVRLQWSLSRMMGYVGVVASAPGRFVASPPSVEPVAKELAMRGLFAVETSRSEAPAFAEQAQNAGLPYVKADVAIDAQESPDAIDDRLLDLERLAASRGFAVAMMGATPAAVDRVAAWAPTLEGKGFVLAPLSAIVKPDRARAQPAPGG